ncbi:hypothetical protein F5888DRAFT_1630243 [Russula emetica]|nr:hypothetical protein F5888DRAFT_1630243 [Russula emetica]
MVDSELAILGQNMTLLILRSRDVFPSASPPRRLDECPSPLPQDAPPPPPLARGTNHPPAAGHDTLSPSRPPSERRPSPPRDKPDPNGHGLDTTTSEDALWRNNANIIEYAVLEPIAMSIWMRLKAVIHRQHGSTGEAATGEKKELRWISQGKGSTPSAKGLRSEKVYFPANTAVDFEGSGTSVQRNCLYVPMSTNQAAFDSFKSAIFSTSFNSP